MKLISHKELSNRIAAGTCFCSTVRFSINGDPIYASCTSLHGSGLTRINYHSSLFPFSNDHEIECFIDSFSDLKKAITIDMEVSKILESIKEY